MKCTLVQNQIVRDVTVDGIVKGSIKYSVTGGTSDVQWTGPVIAPAVWHQILAFFKDTYERTHSECQVRLYLNLRTREWAAWAYPQRLRSMMTTEEIAGEDATKQREQFKDSEGWQYLGTVHHHCGASAFQSSTDRINEVNQDGLHITVGKIDEKQYDIHARFYLSGAEFIPDLSLFWDVGEVARALLPKEVHDIVARHQMTTPAPANTEFPEQWKANLVEPPPPPRLEIQRDFQSGCAANGAASEPGSGGSGFKAHNVGKTEAPLVKRKEWAMTTVRGRCRTEKIDTIELDATCDTLLSNKVFQILQQTADEYDITVGDVLAEWEWDRDIAEQFNGQNHYGV